VNGPGEDFFKSISAGFSTRRTISLPILSGLLAAVFLLLYPGYKAEYDSDNSQSNKKIENKPYQRKLLSFGKNTARLRNGQAQVFKLYVLLPFRTSYVIILESALFKEALW
jgi:hypothetical protein